MSLHLFSFKCSIRFRALKPSDIQKAPKSPGSQILILVLQLCLRQADSRENFLKWCQNSGVARTLYSERGPLLILLCPSLRSSYWSFPVRVSLLVVRELDKLGVRLAVAGRQAGSYCCLHNQVLMVMSQPTLAIPKGPVRRTRLFFLFRSARTAHNAAVLATLDRDGILNLVRMLTWNDIKYMPKLVHEPIQSMIHLYLHSCLLKR